MSDEIRFSPRNDGSEEDCQCARCGSSAGFIDCYNCHDGYTSHDCGEDCCCCLEPEDNVPCDVCEGRGGWWNCLSSYEYCTANPIPGHETIERGKIEWYDIPARLSEGTTNG
jgi:hypothetical protein